jgi:hypothetical protein
MKNEPEALREIHLIREKIYEETKFMTAEERAKHAADAAKRLIEEYHIKAKYVKAGQKDTTVSDPL